MQEKPGRFILLSKTDSLSQVSDTVNTSKGFFSKCIFKESNFGIKLLTFYSRPQRPCSFWSAPRIATSGQVQQHFGFEWICKHNRLRPEPIRFVRLDSRSEHAQSVGKSMNRGLPLLDLARVCDSWCWPKGAQPLGTRKLTFKYAILRPLKWVKFSTDSFTGGPGFSKTSLHCSSRVTRRTSLNFPSNYYYLQALDDFDLTKS